MAPDDAPHHAAIRSPLERIDDAMLMLVDDDALNVSMLQAHLEDAGYRHFVSTSESRDALGLIRQHRPDVVLLDLQMPGISGLEILGQMRQDVDLSGIAVLVVTASTDHQERLRALGLGATDFLHKPVDPAELVLRLRNTLEAKAWRDRLARTDLLTGLPNLAAATEHLQWALTQARRGGRSVAVLQVAVDNFGDVQALGAGAGDALLQDLARRLQNTLRAADLVASSAGGAPMVARDGGEAYTVLLPEIREGEDAVLVAQRLQRCVSLPFEFAGQEVAPTCSIGISLHPTDGATPGDLLALARAALNQAQREGAGQVRCYAADMNARARQKLALTADLRRAVQRGELFLVYQPKRCVRTGALHGAEALVRWQHPRHGLVNPGEFIPLAEQSDLIIEVGDWVLREAVRQLSAWKRAGYALPRVSVNVSPRQLRGHGLLATLDAALGEDEALASRLCLELTEGIMLQDGELAAGLLPALCARGVQLSLDDFGTGYSCLSYLERLPFHELKIDRSFVTGLGVGNAPLVTAIIAMGRALGFRLVAEGVETQAQLDWLHRAGCDEYQGWLASRPLPAEQFCLQMAQAVQGS
ncbi:MAG TPA: EAL domain-containing protein [Ramlibacter sp.]|jgi:diguanylate cyclase (GGDEF)-like protein